MSMRSCGIYLQGAIFYAKDFDSVKVILAACEKICGIELPVRAKDALTNGYDAGIAAELCDLLDIDPSSGKGGQDYSFIADALIRQAPENEWFEYPDPLMGTDKVGVFSYTDIEGEYVFNSTKKNTISLTDGYMFSLDFPFAWEIDTFTGCRTKEEALHCIREAAKTLLKDDIDWEKRLGYLIGATCI